MKKITLCKPGRPKRKPLIQKSLIFLFPFLFLTTVSNAQTIWNTGSFTFSFTAPGQQDCITAQTCLTRVTVLYNSVCQTASGHLGCSYTGPCNTEWSYGDIANWNTLTYQSLYTVNACSPTSMVGNPLVCHLIAENIYLQLTFNSWSPGTNGNFSYTRTTGSALPVLISKFEGRKSGNAIVLDWTSSTEINCSHYNIQRSPNGIDYTTLGKTDSRSIGGNSSITLDYSYTDEHPLQGHNYYRLEQVDKDGRKVYTNVINLFYSNNGSMVVIHQADYINYKDHRCYAKSGRHEWKNYQKHLCRSGEWYQ
jgi:hypothetical protein